MRSCYHRYIICPSVRDGCGCDFSLKLFILGLQRAARYVRHATVGACHRTSNRQEHKIIQRAGPEKDTIFTYVYVSQRADGEAATVTTSD